MYSKFFVFEIFKGKFMAFLNSLKLFGSNFVKILKFYLAYFVVWGISFALLVPSYLKFSDLIFSNFQAQMTSATGVFQGTIGENLQNIASFFFKSLVDIFNTNVGLGVYGLIVILVVMPILLNVVKYTLQYMLYYYMTSKIKVGFFSALVKGLGKSIVYAVMKMIYDLFFVGATFAILYGLSIVQNQLFVDYLLPVLFVLVLALMFSISEVLVLGWSPALIVFDCNDFSAFKKGLKAVRRHFWTIFGVSVLQFLLFWLIILIFGVYPLIVLIPFMTSLLCVYNMVVFFYSQGMRFYVNKTTILTPKKLEEVDNINKTAYIL